MIILHVIRKDGTLTEVGNHGVSVDDLQWTGDTPHLMPREDEKQTAELLWMVDSHTGDYDDNMNSDMFMKWVTNKLVPVFEK